MGWSQADRLIRYWTPCIATILAYEDIFIFTLRAGNVDGLCSILVSICLGIANEEHTINTTAIYAHPTTTVARVEFFLNIREGCYFLPVDTTVGGTPKTIEASTEINDVAIHRVNHHTLTIATTSFIASHEDRHVGALEGLAIVIGTEDRALKCGVCSASHIDTLWMPWVECY